MSGRAAQAIRVLVVDDQRAMRSIVRNMLSQNNISQVTEAEDGAEAMRALLDLRQPNPDVIICDLHLE
ncbi:MAG: response regulator [Alphaproteobacteria bacterium]